VYAIIRCIIWTSLDVALLQKVLVVMPNKYYNTATFIYIILTRLLQCRFKELLM